MSSSSPSWNRRESQDNQKPPKQPSGSGGSNRGHRGGGGSRNSNKRRSVSLQTHQYYQYQQQHQQQQQQQQQQQPQQQHTHNHHQMPVQHLMAPPHAPPPPHPPPPPGFYFDAFGQPIDTTDSTSNRFDSTSSSSSAAAAAAAAFYGFAPPPPGATPLSPPPPPPPQLSTSPSSSSSAMASPPPNAQPRFHVQHQYHSNPYLFATTATSPPPPPKPRQTRVYSDFRIAKIKIGEFELEENNKQLISNRDSRLRLYFKNSDTAHVASPDPNLTDKERALTEPDRMSISMYQGTKRMVIPVQEGLDKVIYNRGEGRFKIKSKGWALFEEISSNGSSSFVKCSQDLTNGQLQTADGNIDVWVDKENPLPMEPKWTRGNIKDYIDARSKFRTLDVLHVEDPEHVKNFDELVGLWIRESNIPSPNERNQFAETKLYKLDYMLELMSKILAPTNYYVSKNAVNDTNTKNAHLAAQIIEAGSIPALISPAVNALIATTANFGNQLFSNDQFVEKLKLVLFQAPEPVIWRSLDGLYAKRTEPLNFNPEKLLESIQPPPPPPPPKPDTNNDNNDTQPTKPDNDDKKS